MAVTSREIRDELQNVLAYLIDSEIALHANLVADLGWRVTWRPFPGAGEFLEYRDPPSLRGYRSWLADGAYSALLYDGSLLQITYDFAGHTLISHRLAWVPCPFAIDPEWLVIASPLDVIDMYTEGRPHDVILRTAVRFDFDIERATPTHPAAHMTINSAVCRIPCVAPLRLGHFVDFVFRNFYPNLWRVHPYLSQVSRSAWGPHTVTSDQTESVHISWRR